MHATFHQLGKLPPASIPDGLFTAGLDLGQRSDYSALAIVASPLWVPAGLPTWIKGNDLPVAGVWVSPTDLMETLRDFAERKHQLARALRERGEKPPKVQRLLPVLSLRYLYRWPLGTSYPQIVSDVGNLMARDPLRGCTSLAIDSTGVGVAITDLFKQAKIAHTAISITGGSLVNTTGNGISVPKRDLAMTTQALLQAGRLRFAASLPLLDILKQELQSFEVKVSTVSGHDTYEAWRGGAHDDIVLAVAMAVWYWSWANQDSGGFSLPYTDLPGAPPYPLD